VGQACATCLLSIALDTAPAEREGAAERPPGKVGPFALLDVLGEGGMGVVYLAEQQYPVRRRVALKLLKQGQGEHSRVARLEAECQTLASLSHPGIAQLYEAGTSEDGRPYFVMEHVDGGPITRAFASA
jgi:serine/threonine protein kinase